MLIESFLESFIINQLALSPSFLAILILPANWCHLFKSSCRLYHLLVQFMAIIRTNLNSLILGPCLIPVFKKMDNKKEKKKSCT